MSEYLSGEELWDKFDSHYCKHNSVRTRFGFGELPSVHQRAWNDLAAELKVPRPTVPTLGEVYVEWTRGPRSDDTDSDIEELRQRLNAAHEARRETNP